MKGFGIGLLITGIGLAFFALSMDTSVKVGYSGGNEYGLPERVNNLGLMSDRQNYLIFSVIIVIVGALILILKSSKTHKQLHNQAPSITQPDLKNQSDNSLNTKSSSIKSIDNSNLINQLHQLQDLKEKNIISDEIFEKQKEIILTQLQENK